MFLAPDTRIWNPETKDETTEIYVTRGKMGIVWLGIYHANGKNLISTFRHAGEAHASCDYKFPLAKLNLPAPPSAKSRREVSPFRVGNR